jgi:hypothetical protein
MQVVPVTSQLRNAAEQMQVILSAHSFLFDLVLAHSKLIADKHNLHCYLHFLPNLTFIFLE